VLGGVLGVWALSDVSRLWLAAVLAHAGGGFIYLALHAVFGELLKHGKGVVLASFVAGVALIALLNVAVRAL